MFVENRQEIDRKCNRSGSIDILYEREAYEWKGFWNMVCGRLYGRKPMRAETVLRVKKLLVCLLTLLLVISTAGTAWGAEKDSTREDTTPVDIIFLLDCSGTMTENDPQGWTAEATKNFVDTMGSENTRLGIISFGAAYGSQAYPVGQQDPNSVGRVKVAYPLSAMNTDDARAAAKKVISDETAKRGEYTPLGYAMEAAVDTLEQGGSADNHAAIVLLSDGIVDGQTDYSNPGSPLDYKSVDSACDRANSHKWPVYCMELNYAGKNVKSSDASGIGYHQMRENIPSRTGTKPFEVKNAKEAVQQLNNIFASFFHADVSNGNIDVDGSAAMDFQIGEMTAEQTLIISGDVAKLNSLSVKGPDGKEESYARSDGDISKDDRKVTFGSNSVLLKMILPSEGKWTLTLKGNAKVSLDWSSISFKEMNLDLSASDPGGDQSVEKGTKVHFIANFSYNGKAYESTDFYAKNPAKLYVTGQNPVAMKASGSGYSADITFPKEGSFDVYAQVDGSYFREGHKKSGTFTYHVERPAPKTKGKIPEVSARIGEKADPISLSDYFEGEDLTYTVEKNKLDDFTYQISDDGRLTLQAGETSKTYQCRVKADDGSGAGAVEQKLTFSVRNRPIELKKEDEVTVRLVKGAKSAPGWVKALRGIGDKDNIFRLDYDDYFYDPDGTKPDIRLIEEPENKKGSGIVSASQTDTALELTANKIGETTYLLVAVDGNTDSTAQAVTLNISVQSAAKAAMEKRARVLVPVFIALLVIVVLLMISFLGRKIYGMWDIEVNRVPQDSLTLSRYRSGKKSRVSVAILLHEMGEDGVDLPKVEIRAGNPFSKKIFFTGLAGIDQVYIDGSPLNEEQKKRPVEIKVNQSIEFDHQGQCVILTRRR